VKEARHQIEPSPPLRCNKVRWCQAGAITAGPAPEDAVHAQRSAPEDIVMGVYDRGRIKEKTKAEVRQFVGVSSWEGYAVFGVKAPIRMSRRALAAS